MKGKTTIYNKGKVRIILIPKSLCIKLLDYVHKSRKGELCEPIFLTRNGTPVDRKQIWRMLKNLAMKAGIPSEKVFPHNLRHLFAREFYRQTKDIVKLSSILGHSSIETTRIYTKETEEDCREEIERVKILSE